MSVKLINDPAALFAAAPASAIFIFIKPDLKPGDKKYEEVVAVQVTAAFLAANPGYKVITKEQPGGQAVSVDDWIITRGQGTDKAQSWPIDNGMFGLRWKAVEGKPGMYSPRSVNTPMIELPEGGKVKASWGFPQGGPGSWLAQYAADDFNVITGQDLSETYLGTDDRSNAKLAEVTARVESENKA